jgi:hypothetical protein
VFVELPAYDQAKSSAFARRQGGNALAKRTQLNMTLVRIVKMLEGPFNRLE